MEANTSTSLNKKGRNDMANNRAQIFCRKCLSVKPFLKYYPGGWFTTGSDLDDWLDIHNEHHDQDFGGENHYGFRTENDDDGFISDYSDRSNFKLTRKPAALPNEGGESKEE